MSLYHALPGAGNGASTDVQFQHDAPFLKTHVSVYRHVSAGIMEATGCIGAGAIGS